MQNNREDQVGSWSIEEGILKRVKEGREILQGTEDNWAEYI